MKLKKYLSIATITTGLMFVLGCSSQPSTIINFNPITPTSEFNVRNQRAILNITVNDLRKTNEISQYTKDGRIIKLSANPSVNRLFDQIIKQDLNSKGFQITNNPSLANINIVANIFDFYAKIGQGNLRHNIKTNLQLEIKVQSQTGEFTKKLLSTRTKDGIFSTDNEEIQKILSESLSDIVQDIYKDKDISNAIQKYTN